MKRPIMIQGCASGVGKSFVVTGLCRVFANRGERVAPFKAMNISNHAAVTSQGEEIGRAQWLQALAARTEPTILMNPVLIKPTSNSKGHVILNGKAAGVVTSSWDEYCQKVLWPSAQASLHKLLSRFERVIIEGAGSPAEVNLQSRDISNMRVAHEAKADVLLVADIEKGGAFAHLLGTFLTLDGSSQALIKGFVINKFAGKPEQLHEGIEWLERKTGLPTVAVIPPVHHCLPEEDTPNYRAPVSIKNDEVEIGIMCYPEASNLDEFDPLSKENGVRTEIISGYKRLDQFHAVILPGSRDTANSLRFLKDNGMAHEISNAAKRGTQIFGVCGGMQMLGSSINDPSHIESGGAAGLGLLDVETVLEPDKVCRQLSVRTVDGVCAKGYEIHHGRTSAGAGAKEFLLDNLGWKQGCVIGVCVHGLFEDTEFRSRFLGGLGWQGTTSDWGGRIEADIEKLGTIMAHTQIACWQ